MPTVTFIEHDGTSHSVSGEAPRSLMQVALENGVPGILGDCGGSCSCATCHCYVDERWLPMLPPMSETEVFMLDGVPDRRPTSRLGCQIPLSGALDGMVVHVPLEQA